MPFSTLKPWTPNLDDSRIAVLYARRASVLSIHRASLPNTRPWLQAEFFQFAHWQGQCENVTYSLFYYVLSIYLSIYYHVSSIYPCARKLPLESSSEAAISVHIDMDSIGFLAWSCSKYFYVFSTELFFSTVTLWCLEQPALRTVTKRMWQNWVNGWRWIFSLWTIDM